MRRKPKKVAGLPPFIAFSLLVHAAFFAAFTLIDVFTAIQPAAAPVYYVDLVNLPVASPRAGSPTPNGAERSAPAPVRAREEMKIPPATPKKIPATAAKKTIKEPSPETDKDFQKRLARLEKKVEGQETESAIEALRRKVASGSGRAGMPGATGTEAGSDYGSYIQSRLRDAFAKTIAFRNANPMVVIRLTIDRSGKVIGYRIERSSGDKVFEDSVSRAVNSASENFPPPPGRKEFHQGFIFKPEGVGKK